MCMTVNTREPIITNEDIVCYKFLVQEKGIISTINGDVATKWISPYREYRWQLDKELTTLLDDNPIKRVVKSSYDIDEGFHSLLSLDDILVNVKNYWNRDKSVVKAFKCVIPKGSKIYRGYWETVDSLGYVSDTIVVKRRINLLDILFDKLKMRKLRKNYGKIINDFF